MWLPFHQILLPINLVAIFPYFIMFHLKLAWVLSPNYLPLIFLTGENVETTFICSFIYSFIFICCQNLKGVLLNLMTRKLNQKYIWLAIKNFLPKNGMSLPISECLQDTSILQQSMSPKHKEYEPEKKKYIGMHLLC